MLIYVLIVLCLSLAGVAGMQFLYMIYLERMSEEKNKRIRELEKHNRHLTLRLDDAEQQIAAQKELLQVFYEEEFEEEEIWADVIEDR